MAPTILTPGKTSPETELIFLGTGTSSSLPQIACIVAPPDGGKPCKTCLSTLKPEGRKNIRRNTSAAIRITGDDGKVATIVIDAGKNFQASAMEWFPKYGLRNIDGLLITHAHADAMNGLDDLRGWTLRGAIQEHIDVYVSLETYTEIKRSFPYLVSKEFASGGGDVPDFKFHIIQDQVPFEVGNTGIKVTPFAVEHGRLFSTSQLCEHGPKTEPPTPPNGHTPAGLYSSAYSIQGNCTPPKSTDQIYPYWSCGYRIHDQVVYISDVSRVPENVWPLLGPSQDGKRLPVAVLDCLRLRPHTSHVGLEGAVKIARRIGASRTYFTGFGHEVSHEEYVRLGEIVGGAAYVAEELTEVEKAGVELIGTERGQWIRPSHDGLRVFISREGARDETYF